MNPKKEPLGIPNPARQKVTRGNGLGGVERNSYFVEPNIRLFRSHARPLKCPPPRHIPRAPKRHHCYQCAECHKVCPCAIVTVGCNTVYRKLTDTKRCPCPAFPALEKYSTPWSWLAALMAFAMTPSRKLGLTQKHRNTVGLGQARLVLLR